jgi:phosphoribosylformylglycinamidine cyclo-ligase
VFAILKSRKVTERRLTYSRVGIDRNARTRSRLEIEKMLREETKSYSYGQPIKLPFGTLFPSSRHADLYYDLQIEGVGTKTLLAELSGNYSTIGIDAVAMAVNDILRSGAYPTLISDAIHISKSVGSVIGDLISGIRAGARMSRCILASGETGTVSEILHSASDDRSLPFDLMVSCLGEAAAGQIVTGELSPGDRIIGLASSGIHSNGLTLARKVLIKKWGGRFDPLDRPEPLPRELINELLEPTRIYCDPLRDVRNVADIRAAVHITGEGFAKFRRLLNWQNRRARRARSSLGFRFHVSGQMPEIFQLIYNTAKQAGTPISMREMFRTFNMGYGFALAVHSRDLERALDSLNKHCPAQDIGYVSTDGKISVVTGESERPLVL